MESNRTRMQRFIRIFSFCFGLSLPSNRRNERDRIFAIATQPYDNRDRFHAHCLYTVYSKLTGNVVNGLRRIGQHWEEIGFQGTDPTTDFRGVGMLGLFQLTFFVIESKQSKALYDLSLDSVQHFPFAIMSMNITQISLQVLREGLLNRMVRHDESMFQMLNRFYYGAFKQFHKVWVEQKKTIVDTGYVLQGKF